MAADVDARALEDSVYREAIDHGLDLAIVERAAIAREEIVDRCTIFEVYLRSFPVSLVRLVRAKPLAECFGMLCSLTAASCTGRTTRPQDRR